MICPNCGAEMKLHEFKQHTQTRTQYLCLKCRRVVDPEGPEMKLYRIKVFYHVETQDEGIVEETGIIGPVKDQEEYTRQLDEFKNRLSRRWSVPLDRITPHTGELIR